MMTRFSLQRKGGFASGAEFSLDANLLCASQGTLKLEQKLTHLFEILRGPIYRYLMVIFANPAEAEEITQEVFLRLCRHLSSRRSVGNVRAWVFRVAHNLAIDRQRLSTFAAPPVALSWEDIVNKRQDMAPNPEQRVLDREKFERVHIALGRLSPRERQCLHLRAEGFRYREIAEILSISTSSVTEFLHRAIRKMVKETHV